MTGAFRGERVLVVGFGASGRAAASVLVEEGAEVRVSESRPAAGLDPEHDSPPEGIELLAGGHRPEHLDGRTLVVTSPGVPEHAPVLRWALERGLPVWSELELGARLCRVPVVAVTGTNGKTTTVELVAAMMRAAGLEALACGNVGYPFSLAAREPHQALAVEASSFQLRFHRSFRPPVSVLLNLAPDHLDWHASFEAYAEAKARVFELQEGEDVHVGNADDPAAAAVSARARCSLRWFGSSGGADGGRREDVVVSAGAVLGGPGMPGGERAVLGHPAAATPALLADAAAASAAALAFGLPSSAVSSALASFAPLPHRGTVIAEAGGVRFVDDSKATNPHAALAALAGLSDAVLIAGGLTKGVDLSPLAGAADRLAGVVAIGEAARELVRVFRGLVPVTVAGSMEEAVEAATALAAGNGTVILAPACASQDMFRDYRERGDRFAAAARRLAAEADSTPAGPDEPGVAAPLAAEERGRSHA